MDNKQVIQSVLKANNMVLGCWDSDIERLNKTNLKKVLEEIPYQSATSIKVFINRVPHMVSLDFIEDAGTVEADFSILTLKEYIDRYGEE